MGREAMARASLWLGVIGSVAAVPLVLAAVVPYDPPFDVFSDLAVFGWLSPPLLLAALINGVLARREGRPALAGILLAIGTGAAILGALYLASARVAGLQALAGIH